MDNFYAAAAIVIIGRAFDEVPHDKILLKVKIMTFMWKYL